MRKAIGFLIVLWGLSQYFSTSFVAIDDAASESFKLLEVSAVVSQQKIMESAK
jgi:hypothetical protein